MIYLIIFVNVNFNIYFIKILLTLVNALWTNKNQQWTAVFL